MSFTTAEVERPRTDRHDALGAQAGDGTVIGVDSPVLVFDGDCAFCSSSVRLLERLLGRRPEIVAWQEADLDALGLTPDECAAALQWVGPDGDHRSGAAAVAATLRYAGRGWALIGRALEAPGLRRVAAGVYDLVARNRHRLPGGTPACSVGATDDRHHPRRSVRGGGESRRSRPGAPRYTHRS